MDERKIKAKVKKKYVEQLCNKYYITNKMCNEKYYIYYLNLFNIFEKICVVLFGIFLLLGVLKKFPMEFNIPVLTSLVFLTLFFIFSYMTDIIYKYKLSKVFYLEIDETDIELSKINPDEILDKCKELKTLYKKIKSYNINKFNVFFKYRKVFKKHFEELEEIKNYILSLERRR